MLSAAAIALANGVALIPGGGAIAGGVVSAFGYLLRCSTCLKVLGIAALVGWAALHVHHADAARCEAHIEDDHRKAEAAAAERDANVKRDLTQLFGPKLSQLQAENLKLQDKVKTHAKRKPAAPAAGGCRLGDAADLLRPDKSR
jgi:hypothetical protein